jgi:hypothetical protein
MKNIKFVILFMVLYSSNNLIAQTYETMSKVYIPSNAKIIKTVKVKNCDEVIKAGNIVKKEETKTNGTSTFTITKIDTLTNNKAYPFEKTITKEMTDFDGFANLSTDEKDKSILHVNYWLNGLNKLKSNDKVRIRTRELNCNKSYSEKDTSYRLAKDTTVRLWKTPITDTTKDWFQNSNLIYEVYNKMDSSKIEYYLVNKYDNNADYSIKLDNRDFISYHKRSIEFGPLTIPFKLRFGYSKNNIAIKQEFSADLNLGVYAGYKLGKYRVRYEGTSLKDLSNVSVSVGGFLNLSSISLDSASTSVGKVPFTKDEKATIGIISPGIGLMVSVYNVQLGAFLGWDVGFGKDAKNWNFNNKPWLGFGLAYNLTGFWKK